MKLVDTMFSLKNKSCPMSSRLISILQPVRRSSARAVKTPSHALVSFAAAEATGSAVPAGHLPQALAGIVGVSQRQEPFLVNHTPQQLHNQSLKAHLLFEFLGGSTEDEIWFSINRSLVPLMFPLGSEERSDDVAGILLFPLRNSTWGFLLPLAYRGRRNYSAWASFIVNPHKNFPHSIKSQANILVNWFILRLGALTAKPIDFVQHMKNL